MGQSELRLLPDSTVAGLHYDRLQRWAAFSLAGKEQRRHMAREIASRDRLLRGMDTEVATLRGALERWEGITDTLEMANKALQMDLQGCQLRGQRLKPWATIGKIATVTVTVGVVVATYILIKNETDQQ